MRVFGRLCICAFLGILLSGSLPVVVKTEDLFKQERQVHFAEILAEQEENLEAYRQKLQQTGEEMFATQAGELKRSKTQELHSASRTLKEQMEAANKTAQEKVERDMLQNQLQLFLVSLSGDERQERLERVKTLQDSLVGRQNQLQEDLEDRLAQLQLEYEESLNQELKGLRQNLERALAEEFAEYRLVQLRVLEEQIAEITPNKLLRSYVNR